MASGIRPQWPETIAQTVIKVDSSPLLDYVCNRELSESYNKFEQGLGLKRLHERIAALALSRVGDVA